MNAKNAKWAVMEKNWEKHLEDIVLIHVLAPLGDPTDPDCPKGIQFMFWGLSGLGKSARVQAAILAMGIKEEHFESLFLGCHPPEDLAGVPVPDGKGGAVMAPTLAPIKRLLKAARGFLFLDEATCTTPATQGAAQVLIHDKRCGEEDMGPGIGMGMAGNPPEFATGGYDLSPALANRPGHYYIGPPTLDAWESFLTTEFAKNKAAPRVSVNDGDKLVKANFKNHISKWYMTTVGCLRAKKEWGGSTHGSDSKGHDYGLFHQQPLADDPAGGGPWPSPRTWHLMCKCLATLDCLGYDKGRTKELRNIIVEGFVGEGASRVWIAYAKNLDLPDPREALENGVTINDARPDITQATFGSIISFVLNLDDQDEQYKYAALAWQRIMSLIESGGDDIAVKALDALASAGLGVHGTPPDVKAVAKEVILHFGTKSPVAKYLKPKR
jgi:hypothetical protein